ncbi:hypothetical protein C8R46DRAFT_1097575 [Mycena filopes]|nr:hypothetical protein C8R46DRAFT_1097575 [Mycena filopes]
MALLTLPNELLVAIAAAGSNQDHIVVRRRYRCEWTLSQVSRRLREVIIGAPTLWTLVELDLHHRQFTDIAQVYLSRSRACHICVLFRETKDIDSDHLIAERIRVLVPHLSRIKRLRLFLYVDPEVALSPLRHVHAPNLERLEIMSSIDPPDSTRAFEIFSLGLPKLIFLSMKGVAPNLPLPPWTGALTHLEFDGYEMSLAAKIIAQSPSLVHLSLGMVDVTVGRLCIPSLNSLRLSIPDSEDDTFLLAIFDIFDTPALIELIIGGTTHADQIFALFDSTSLPHSSFPALAFLTFDNQSDQCSFAPEINPIPPPRLFPALSSLTLIRQCFTSTLVGMLVSTGHPWPLLKTLTVCPLGWELDAVSDTLWNARPTKPRALPEFRLSGSLLARMRKREKEGDEESGMDMKLFDPTELMAPFG